MLWVCLSLRYWFAVKKNLKRWKCLGAFYATELFFKDHFLHSLVKELDLMRTRRYHDWIKLHIYSFSSTIPSCHHSHFSQCIWTQVLVLLRSIFRPTLLFSSTVGCSMRSDWSLVTVATKTSCASPMRRNRDSFTFAAFLRWLCSLPY